MSLIKDIFGGKTDSEDIDYELKDKNENIIHDGDGNYTSEWEEDWLGVERPEGKNSGSDS